MIENILMIVIGASLIITNLFFDSASWWFRNPRMRQTYERFLGFHLAVGAILVLAGFFFLVTGQ